MIKVKVPKEVSYGCFTYKVYLDESQKDAGYDGSCMHSKGEIRIDPVMIEARKLSAFVHENLHFVNKNYCAGLSEDTLAAVASGVAEFLGRNLGIELDWSDVPSLKLTVEEKEIKE